MVKRLLLCCCLLLFVVSVAGGDEPPASGFDSAVKAVDEPAVPPDQEPGPTGVQRLEGTHRYLSSSVESLSRRIDAFFGAERAYAEGSGTYVLASGSSIYRKGGEFDFDSNVKARLDLPNLKKRLALVIESDIDETIADTRNTTGAPSVRESLDEQQVAASVQVVLKEEEHWDVRLQPGIKLHLPPETFIRLRMRRPVALNETWLTRYTLTPGWYDSRGWEIRGTFDLERDTGNGALFRASSEIVWLYDEPDNLSLAEVFSFSHPLGAREWMAYSTGATGETYPTCEDTSYFANIRYRRDIHQGWMFLELKPQVLFAREENFKPDPSFALTLELLFGSRYYRPPGK